MSWMPHVTLVIVFGVSFHGHVHPAQSPARTLIAVLAHPDDEGAAAPVLARYAREGVRVHLIIATDGAQGNANTSIPRGPDLARARADEAGCAARALGALPPVMLAFPDAKLGDYASDPSLLYRLSQRLADEMKRLRPDAVITWGPDGGTGHPDHRIVSSIVTQLARARAPGMPDRLFYMSLPVAAFHAMNPQRGAPPLLIPASDHFNLRIEFRAEDLAAAQRSLACHRTQFSEDVMQRVFAAQASAWNGAIPLAATFTTTPGNDLFR